MVLTHCTLACRLRLTQGAKTLSSSKTKKRAVALDVRGIGVPVEIRRHAGARRLTLRVSKTRRTVVVTVPDQCRMDEADRFLNSHIDWVRERLGRVPAPVPFADGAHIPLRGDLHRVVFTGAGRGRPVVKIEPSADMPSLAVAGEVQHAARRLKEWLFAQAHADLDRSVSRHARSLGVRARRIGLRDQTTRWGSCSANGLLSFSWRLILAPAYVLDYVAAHEVAHLVEMNHGARFWKLVAQSVPRLEEAKTWLRQQGSDLHRYG
jgi:predicted metal-dependent hydrolase